MRKELCKATPEQCKNDKCTKRASLKSMFKIIKTGVDSKRIQFVDLTKVCADIK